MTKQNKIRGSLIGGAIGDALGYPIEFIEKIKEQEYIRYNDTGIISDDTQMTLFTANALIWRETRTSLKGIAVMPVGAIHIAYLDWLDTQNNSNSNENKISWIKDIKELNIRRAPGNTCLNALNSGKIGTLEEPLNNSKGCGGIMRVAPIGLYIQDPKKAGKFAAEASAITHGHPLGIIPSYVFATLLNLLINTDMNIEKALNEAMSQYVEEFDIYDNESKEYFIQLVNKAVDLSKKSSSDIEAIKELGAGWVAEETFAIAVYACLKYSNSFEDAVVCAINHDGDSDSTGAVAGNIIGAYLGYSSIPNYYIDNLELKDIILELADDLSMPVPIGASSDNEDEYWLSKYLYCNRDIGLKKGDIRGE